MPAVDRTRSKGSLLVTGASGLLGAAVVRAAQQSSVPAVGMLGRGDCDLADWDALQRFAEKLDVSRLVHSAALTAVDHCERVPADAFAANVVATRNVARLARERGARLLDVSTASVFSGQHGGDREGDPPHPQNFYSLTKLLGEEAALASGAIVLRAVVIGLRPRERASKNFLEWLVSSLRDHRDIKLFTDIRFNPLSDSTLANIILTLLDQAPPAESTWHAGTRQPCSKADVGRLVQARYFPSYSGKIDYAPSPEPKSGGARRSQEMWLNVDKISGVIPMPSIEEELGRIFEGAREKK